LTRISRATSCCSVVLQRHGWALFAHPLFLDQLDRLTAAATRARRTDPKNWQANANVKLLAALRELVLNRVPRNPLAAEYRQDNTLGGEKRHWFRAKFGANRFRLFFRADSASRIIVCTWFNNRDSLRKAGAATDPYAIFSGMLDHDNPPKEWTALLSLASAPEAVSRLRARSTDPDS
jgi:toxin YhaV